MLPTANTELFNPILPKAHNSECQNLLFLLQIKPLIVSYSWFADCYFLHPRH